METNFWPTATPLPSLSPEERRPSKKPKTVSPTLTQVQINGIAVELQSLERSVLRRLHADHGNVVDILTLAQNTYGLGSITVAKATNIIKKLRETFEKNALAGVRIERVLEPSGYRLVGVTHFSDDIT